MQAGIVALLQHADSDGVFKSWHVGCAVLLGGSQVRTNQLGVLASSSTVDLDFWMMDSDGNEAAISASHDKQS